MMSPNHKLPFTLAVSQGLMMLVHCAKERCHEHHQVLRSCWWFLFGLVFFCFFGFVCLFVCFFNTDLLTFSVADCSK